MELKDFIGKHILTGCQYGGIDDAQTVDFILDGRTFSVIEDPDDGYRSSMKEIVEGCVSVTNVFAPCEVFGVVRPDSVHGENDIIDFYDTKTDKVVLSVGTADTDDYYPYFVGCFTPENMAVNSK